MNDSKFIQPFLKWAGGKRQLKKCIISMCPKFEKYYEPFVGSGAILFALQPKKAIINDINKQLYITYNAVKYHPDDLIEKLEEHKKKDSSSYFYELRNLDRKPEFESMNNIDKAARLIYLNKTCYNGLYRVNSRKEFNTPYNKCKTHNIFNENIIHSVSEYLRNNNIIIRNRDFVAAVRDAKEGDFVYFDPPYRNVYVNGKYRQCFTGYHANGFNERDQKRLERLIRKLTDRNVSCLLSNPYTESIEDLYNNSDYFVIREIETYVSIGSSANRRRKIVELLISNKVDGTCYKQQRLMI